MTNSIEQFTSSANQDWETPSHIWKKFEKEYVIKFVRDLCASKANAICEDYYTKDDDGLEGDWSLLDARESNWCNPEYGTGQVPRWVEMAWWNKSTTNTVILLPCNKLDQPWFHKFAVRDALVVFVEGRIQFSLPGKSKKSGNSQGSVFVCFGPAFEPGIASFKQDKEFNK